MAKLDGVKTLDMVNGEITKVAYGGAEYERVEGEAEVGDIVLITTIGWTDAREGEFYKAVGVDSDGDAKIKDDRGTIDSHFRCNYDLFRKVAAINPSVEERVAKAEGEIESLKSDVAALKGAAEYKRIAKSEARAGDYVKFDEAPRGYLTAGKYYEIDYVDSNGDPYITDDAGDVFDTYCLDDDEFEVYRKVSAESVEAEPKTERLKVGDYAKVVKNVRSHEVEVGTLLLVTAIDNEPPFIKCDELSGNRIGWFYEDELVRATDDEVAEAKRAAKWAEIGREVGEYKKGDFVKLTLRSGGIFFGEITEHRVGNTYGFKHLHAEYGTTSEYSRDLTLVTPVEARFDR
ncbi:hypothetical protein J7W01_14510 [Bacillus subtilis]|uniref:hypothetical protein n=1 Tax=Bacillus subtilis TaxID=1423 RepID=UPI001ADD86A2|nr:hypothetical protein [Bacillus subtilis]MBG9809127.1 hypothetical protein [Bacillus subtilis]QTM25144.1 hypothetical protein J7W01_14510 [Bacillus subtilis]